MSDSPAEIARGLTEKEREALLWIKPHSILANYKWPTATQKLVDAGLVERATAAWVSITPNGEAVRAQLQKGKSDE